MNEWHKEGIAHRGCIAGVVRVRLRRLLVSKGEVVVLLPVVSHTKNVLKRDIARDGVPNTAPN
jgi:hypothetical protein